MTEKVEECTRKMQGLDINNKEKDKDKNKEEEILTKDIRENVQKMTKKLLKALTELADEDDPLEILVISNFAVDTAEYFRGRIEYSVCAIGKLQEERENKKPCL